VVGELACCYLRERESRQAAALWGGWTVGNPLTGQGTASGSGTIGASETNGEAEAVCRKTSILFLLFFADSHGADNAQQGHRPRVRAGDARAAAPAADQAGSRSRRWT